MVVTTRADIAVRLVCAIISRPPEKLHNYAMIRLSSAMERKKEQRTGTAKAEEVLRQHHKKPTTQRLVNERQKRSEQIGGPSRQSRASKRVDSRGMATIIESYCEGVVCRIKIDKGGRKGSWEGPQKSSGEKAGMYRGQVPDNNSEANAKLKAGTTLKTTKENLKPRKNDRPKVQFIQGNLQKSHTGQIELNKQISKLNKEAKHFVCLVQEPCSSRS